MKKILLYLALVIVASACSDSFLDRFPKGRWHHGNYNDSTLNINILVEAKLAQTYETLRSYTFSFAGFGMQNYTTPDVEKGSSPSDGQQVVQFKPLSYTASNNQIGDYYSVCYSSIFLANEAIALATSLSDTVPNKNEYLAEAIFLRSVMYFRLTQAFGGVPFVDKVLGQTDKTPARSTREEMWKNLERDLSWSIPYLPSRRALLASGNSGRATQNAARAVLAKVYLYQKKWALAMNMTSAIISSGDNGLTTPYDQIFSEAKEYGDESVFEVYCEEKPDDKIYLGSQFGEIQGVRGIPDLGWGFNAPSQVLMDAYEAGDPRKAASIIASGDVLDGKKIKADAGGYQYFNKKAYTAASERGVFGRPVNGHAGWLNIRLIRYADVVLMHAEAACELGNTTEALDKLEMVRARARGNNSSVLPKITTTDIAELRAKIHQERRIELAMEWERFYDLVRWGEAKAAIGANFVIGKHELFPIPLIEITKSDGVITQNPGY
ncbi:MAG: RagB/SusD family nutrient uptake outer membrane protein [Bacteroidales bacterium]|nr:RagB/SusD family nutrient uptake outer membrane protein [Bacteroidales bacterium]